MCFVGSKTDVTYLLGTLLIAIKFKATRSLVRRIHDVCSHRLNTHCSQPRKDTKTPKGGPNSK